MKMTKTEVGEYCQGKIGTFTQSVLTLHPPLLLKMLKESDSSVSCLIYFSR